MFRIQAIKEIHGDPPKYGFHVEKTDLYHGSDWFEVPVDSGIEDFADFAKEFNTNYKILKYLNPWLRRPYLTNRQRKTYDIRLPAIGARNRAGYFEDDWDKEDFDDFAD